MDTILPNKLPYRLKVGKKATIVFGQPMYFDDLVVKLKKENKSAVSYAVFFSHSFKC